MWQQIERQPRIAVRGTGGGDSAATASEYVSILAVVIITIMVSAATLGKKVNTSFGDMGDMITTAASGNDAGKGEIKVGG